MTDRILIVRLGSLGDLVHTLPAASALRRAYPSATIDWLVDAPHREFLELVPILSSIVVLKTRGAGGWLEARRTLRARRYDVALDFQGLVKSAALAWLSGARRTFGFDRAAARESLATLFYSERVPVGEGSHVVQKNLRLAAAAGATDTSLDFPLREVASPAVDTFVAQNRLPFALINPGAAWPNKRWPPDRLGQVAQFLNARHDLSSVVLWGPGEEDVAKSVVNASAGTARLAPPTGLQELIALTRHARLMVSGDTGPTHIACALGVPVVGLFGPTNPKRNGPWDPHDISISRYDSCACHYQRRCHRAPGEWCLGQVTVEQVTETIDQRLHLARAASAIQSQ